MITDRPNRRTQALAVARELVDVLERESEPIERCLMRAQRLARLLRDAYAQTWLDYETRGYPEGISLSNELGPCAKYAYRVRANKEIYRDSLPKLEANVKAAEIILGKAQVPTINATADDYVASGATQLIIKHLAAQVKTHQSTYTAAVTQLARMRSHLYRYAVDTLVSLEFGDVAEDIFQTARNHADEFVRRIAPKAAEQLLEAQERMIDGSPEALSAAMTSCRRVLCTVADAVFPSSNTPHVDASGQQRRVGPDEYKNRLLAYVETRVTSQGSTAVVDAQISHLGARLDAVYAKACKGVHDDVTLAEARLVLIQTYLFLAEIGRLAPTDLIATDAPAIPP